MATGNLNVSIAFAVMGFVFAGLFSGLFAWQFTDNPKNKQIVIHGKSSPVVY